MLPPFAPFALPGARARFVPLSREHAPDLLAGLDHDRVWDYIPWPRPRSLTDMQAYIDAALAAHAGGTEIAVAMLDTHGSPSGHPRAVGTSRFTDISLRHRSCEIGWTIIAPAVQRTSINTEAKLTMLTFAFETLNCVRVQLKCDGRNIPSQNAILRLGASFEGRLRKHRILPDGYIRDTMMYSITDDDWPRIKAHLERLRAPRPA